MYTTNYKKFKGEIENYVNNSNNIFESRIDHAFSMLKIRTNLSRTKIKKKDGYHAAHLLFVLTLLPLLKINTVHSFCLKKWYQWSGSKKDSFYRFKQGKYRWRTFMYQVLGEILAALNIEQYPLEDRYFVIDDTVIPKRGRDIQNVSFIHDHNLGRSVLGFCVVTLGLFTGQNFYPIDFAYRFGKKRHPKSPDEKIGDPRSISGQRSYEAKHKTKLELSLAMIQTAIDRGIRSGYVLFDSWYGWPVFINARDAMPGGGKLTIETANADLNEDYAKEHDVSLQPGPYVMLGVSDTGTGMDEETRSLIFEPFFTTKEVGKGTGLGLSTVYGIVKQSGGYIWVYSEPGQGTTFKIYLPAVEGAPVQVQKEKLPPDDLTGSETILIVEDDDVLRNLGREILQQQGYRILEAENGIEALRISEEHGGQIHLMITDVVMPKMGGKEVADRLQPLYPQMKVIYMSGYTDNSIAHHGILAPGLNFLEKPFSPEVLARKVREVLDKKQD